MIRHTVLLPFTNSVQCQTQAKPRHAPTLEILQICIQTVGVVVTPLIRHFLIILIFCCSLSYLLHCISFNCHRSYWNKPLNQPIFKMDNYFIQHGLTSLFSAKNIHGIIQHILFTQKSLLLSFKWILTCINPFSGQAQNQLTLHYALISIRLMQS